MAKTEFTTSHALRKVSWSAIMFNYARHKAYFSKFIGKMERAQGVDISTSPNALIQMKADFKKAKGDKVVFAMMAALEGSGVAGDSTLEGNEEALTFLDFDLELKQTRNAVRSEGELSDRRVIFDAKMKAKDALGSWLAHQLDNYTLASLSGLASADGNVAAKGPTAARKWCGGQSSAGSVGLAGIVDAGFTGSATDEYFGTKVIEIVKRLAVRSEPIVRPIIVDGKEYYVMFIHPYQAKALKGETEWRTSQQTAGVRGLKNPIFQGALGIWDGVILHEWGKIETRYGEAGSTATEAFETADPVTDTVYAARALFCGAQAAVQAYGKLPYFRAETFDYKNEWGVAVGAQIAVEKPTFSPGGTARDYGVITVDTQYVGD